MPLPEQNIRGVKRKRPDGKESEEDKEAKLRQKLHHALRKLCKIAKKTRTFEVQKTLKKLKDARRKDPEGDVTKDLGAQMEVLKHLSYDHVAHSALVTKLKKDKTLSADPLIQAVSEEFASNIVSPGAPGTPTAKVQSRVLSSKVLASEVVSVVEALRTFLHPPVGSEGIGEATDDSHASLIISKRRRDAILSEDNAVGSSGGGSDGGHENTSGDEAVADDWESGAIGAPSESDDSVAGAADDDSSSADFSSKDPKGQSEFLPSLSTGFTRGDSSSEFSDSEMKSVDGIKKNRRGQRARRAIWEKKYGRNANHVKKQRQQDTERRLSGSASVDRRSGKGKSSSRLRAPTYGHRQVREPTLRGSEDVTTSSSTKGRSEHVRRRGKRGDLPGPLHPSWEAKRKQRSVGIVASQGTKITFSES